MSIKSSFLPKEVLQGQDIPAYVLWSALSFDSIHVYHSKNIELKEAYNVLEKESSDDGFIIRKVDIDGYLGLLFSSKILPERIVDDAVRISFLSDKGEVESLEFKIHLFRPDIQVGAIPTRIYVDPETGVVTPKILVKNLGEGTAIVDLVTTAESSIKRQRPRFVELFVQDLVKRVASGIERMRIEYPKYESLLGKIERLFTKPFKFEPGPLESYETFEEDFRTAVEENIEFGKALGELFIEIILKNIEYSNVYQFVADYMNSIGKERILIRDPFNVIKVTSEPATICIKIMCIDLLKQACEPTELEPIVISGKKEGEIALFKLFAWGENNHE